MKKRYLVLLALFLLVGCGKVNKEKLQDKLTTMGNDYYSKYMKGSNLDIAVITIKDFKEANENMSESYDLKDFSNCDENTSIKIYLKSGTTQIDKYEFEINCKN